VHAQFSSCSALIPFVVSQHRQDKHALELAQGFIEWHPTSVHLRNERFELRLHNELSLTSKLQYAPVGIFLGQSSEEEKNTQMEKAMILVML
jgi:hypothetical protein